MANTKRNSDPSRQNATVKDVDEWAEASNRTFAARERILADPRLKDRLFADAQFGRKMRHVSAVSDDALVKADQRVRQDFPSHKARDIYARVGLEVGLSWSQARDRLLRLRKK